LQCAGPLPRQHGWLARRPVFPRGPLR